MSGLVLLITFVELILFDLSWVTGPVWVTSTFCGPYGPTCPSHDPGVKKTGLGRHDHGLDLRDPGLGLDLALLGLGPDPC